MNCQVDGTTKHPPKSVEQKFYYFFTRTDNKEKKMRFFQSGKSSGHSLSRKAFYNCILQQQGFITSSTISPLSALEDWYLLVEVLQFLLIVLSLF
jgi:hypothetical protein